jgi:Ca2+-binding EF-hand superfamily protein
MSEVGETINYAFLKAGLRTFRNFYFSCEDVPTLQSIVDFWKIKSENGQISFDLLPKYYHEYTQGQVSEEEATATMNLFQDFIDSNNNVNVTELALCLLLVAPGGADDTLVNRVESIFQVIDEDNSGDLDRHEIGHILKILFHSTPKFLKALSLIDNNAIILAGDDGVAIIETFVREAPKVYVQEKLDAMLQNCFDTCDTDKNGTISLEEWKTWFLNPKNLTDAFGPGGDLLLA